MTGWAEAQKHLAGGVNSPVRAFKAVGGDPVIVKRAKGAYLYDTSGKRYLDFCLSWGAILLGHAHPKTVKAITAQAKNGTSFGTATDTETALAREIKKAFPGMDKIRFTSSGTEAVMSALRLARGVTRKNRVVKFEGGYHGHADSLLVKAGSGLATLGLSNSAGVPEDFARLTTVLPYNDIEAARVYFKKCGQETACVILEPIAANMGVVPAKPEFLAELRRLTQDAGALLIFDEVITGYRLTYGGAQHLYKIKPDITILGKIIGGGLPVGAFGASGQIMDHLAPNGPVYQAGTLSGNPLSMAAGLSVLSGLSLNFYRELNQKMASFLKEARRILKKRGRAVNIQEAGSMFTLFFTGRKIENFKDVCASDTKAFKTFFHRMLRAGVYLPPSAFEASFLCQAHSQKELEHFLRILYST